MSWRDILCATFFRSPAISKGGQLKHALEFQDGEGGFAWFTRRAWIIEPSGEWRVVPFHHRPLDTPLRQGKLTEARVAALPTHLATQDSLTRPTQLGGRLPSNPRQLTSRFGDKATTLGE